MRVEYATHRAAFDDDNRVVDDATYGSGEPPSVIRLKFSPRMYKKMKVIAMVVGITNPNGRRTVELELEIT